MTKYSAKGLMIFQVSNAGPVNTNPPTTPKLTDIDNWVAAYKPAGATGIDPRRRTTPYYVYYGKDSSGKSGWIGAVPYNFIIDAKTRKILWRGGYSSSFETTFSQYLN